MAVHLLWLRGSIWDFRFDLSDKHTYTPETLPIEPNCSSSHCVDWNRHTLTDIYKLSVIDTGIGMTGEEMVTYSE
jgi:hypothetical protein